MGAKLSVYTPKAHNSGGKCLYTLKGGHSYKHILKYLLRQCGIPWNARPPPPLWVTTNCHIQSIKTNTTTKAVHNIQSRLENQKLGHRKVQTLIKIGEDACGSKSSSVLLT